MSFKKAVRSEAKIKVAVAGPSGSGKTYGALEIASGLGKRVALVDSENGSASLYSDRFDFDTLVIKPPFTTEKYISAINDAVEGGYDTVVVDSITHAWSGEGGLLQQKEQLDQRGGNSFANWAKITPKHEKLIAAILHSDINIIATMRSKQDYVLSDKNGKQVPMKVGLAPQQREGFEFEFTTVFDVAMNHEAAVSKDRTGLFDGKIFKITKKTGEEIKAWLKGAAKVETELEVKYSTQNPGNTYEACKRLACHIGDEDMAKKVSDSIERFKDNDEKLLTILGKIQTYLKGNA